MQGITQFLSNFTEFTKEEESIILSKFSLMEVPVKTQLVSFDQKTDDLYFIIKGCIHKYCMKDGQSVTLLIATEKNFALEYVSFMNGGPSENVLETLEDCILINLKKADLESLYVEVPKMNEVMRKVLEKAIYDTHILLNSFITLSPEERYLNLLETQADLIGRIPQYVLASYLGVSATSLSRIRKRVAKG